MEKTFNPQLIEKKHYQKWEDSNNFAPKGTGNPYSIMIPPPNVTGSLHMGHAFQNAIMDALIRYNRMDNKNTLWQVGTDHAGIATQMVVERKLMLENNKSRHEYGREKFVEKVWEWKQESGANITKQLRRLGASADWNTERFTMDEGFYKGVKEAFIRLYEDDLIYRGKRLVNWDPALQTAISDVEVENKEVKGSMWYMKYHIDSNDINDKDFIVVATTRPETIFADVAVAVNPNDERYQNLIGKHAIIPLVNRKIPIIADDYADMNKGTGCVKITPAHDFNDYQVGVRHNLPLVNIMDKSAHIVLQPEVYDLKGNTIDLTVNIPTEYQQLDRFTARDKIITNLIANNLLEKQEDHSLTIPYGDRSSVIIEPLLTDQWFVRATKLAEPAIKAVESGEIKFVPEQYKNMYLSWMKNIEDWCISRQLWWGHQVPAWYDAEGKVYVGYSEQDVRTKYNLTNGIKLTEDLDVLDTWFSSSLWTFLTLGWPETTERLTTFHPTDVLVTGFDIIFFWVARMIFMSLYLVKDAQGKPQIPFKYVYITGLIRDEKGVKMSKSKGNVLDPLDMIDGISLENLIQKRCSNMMQPKLATKIEQATRKQFPQGIAAYGTDALRFTLYSLASTGRNINWDMQRLEGYRNFCNKIWNAANYVFLHTADYEQSQQLNYSTADRWIISIFQKLVSKIRKNIAEFRLDHAAYNLYNFIWNEYCAWYLELTKQILFNKEHFKNFLATTQFNLLNILEQICRLLHPFMPFITEEIWLNTIPKLELTSDSLLTASYPQANDNLIDEVAENEIQWLKAVVTAIRAIRTEMNLSKNQPLDVTLKNTAKTDGDYLAKNETILKSLAKVNSIVIINNDVEIPCAITQMVGAVELQVSMQGLIDITAEIARLTKDLSKIEQDISRLTTKLGNQKFIANAPEAIVAKENEKLLAAKTAKQRIEQCIEQLQS